MSGKRDSNSRPQPWQGCALPTELFPQFVNFTPLLYPFLKCECKNIAFNHINQKKRYFFQRHLEKNSIHLFKNGLKHDVPMFSWWELLAFVPCKFKCLYELASCLLGEYYFINIAQLGRFVWIGQGFAVLIN